MKNLKFKRVLSFLLAFTLIFSLLPVGALAAELDGEPVCTHVHDEYCGYVDAADCLHVHDEICSWIEGEPCTHECGEDCDPDCIHTEHDADCGYIEPMPCLHTEHDEFCGYADAAPCNHVCDEDCGGDGNDGGSITINATGGASYADYEASPYTCTVDIFNYDPNNLPVLYDMTGGGEGTLINAAYNTSNSTSNGFLRMTFSSTSDKLSIRAKNSMENSGAFGDGSFELTADYPHVYLVGGSEYNTSQAKSSLNPPATFYARSTVDEKIELTAIKAQAGALSMTYWSPSSGDKVITSSAIATSLSEIPELIPNGTDGAMVNGLKVFTVKSDDTFSAGTAIWFYVRGDFGNGTESVFSSDPANTASGRAHTNAKYIMPGTPLPDTSWYDGHTTDTTFNLTTADQLAGLAELVNGGNEFSGKTITLNDDIDLSGYQSGTGWTPIGTYDNQFKGTFDGGNYKITDLKITGATTDYQGLFGYIGSGGTVKNLTVDCVITVGDNGNAYTGGIAGGNAGTIENCHVAGSLTHNGTTGSPCLGGVAGSNSGTISNCSNAATVSGSARYGGGIAGYMSDGTVDNCVNTGSVESSYNSSCVGGIAGQIGGGTVKNSRNAGAEITGYNSGGIAGYTPSDAAKIINCANTGDVTGVLYSGGIAGLYAGTAQNCYSTGTVTGTGTGTVYVGGVVGRLLSSGTIENLYWNTGAAQTVDGTPRAEGDKLGVGSGTGTTTDMTETQMKAQAFADTLNENALSDSSLLYWTLTGSADGYPVLTDVATTTTDTTWYTNNTSAATFTITTADELAGLAELVNGGTDSFDGKTITFTGLTENISLFPNEWTPIGTLSKPFKGTFDGGGHIFSGLDINSQGATQPLDNVGLFGYISGATITRVGVEVFGIVGKDNVGGIVGFAENNSTITNCYVTYYPYSFLPYAISGRNNVGGIAGTIMGSIENCYNTADIDGTNSVGGIAGYATEWVDNRIFACYNTGNISGLTGQVGGIVGKLSGTDVIGCFNTGDGSDANYNFGSIWGYKYGDSIITDNYRYKFAKMLGYSYPSSYDDATSMDGGIASASALWSKETYEANGWRFVDSTPTTGPWVWDTAYTYPKLGFGTESYPFNFYFDASPHEQAASTNRTVTVTPHKKVTGAQWATATGVTPPSSGFANILGSTLTMPIGEHYLHLKGSFDGSQVTGIFGTYSVLAVPITSAAVTVTTPVTGSAKSTAATVPNGANYTSSAVTWSPNNSKFLGNTIYTATVTLTANEGYTFTGLATATINGSSATISNNTGGTVTLTYAFPQTGDATVVRIAVSTQPTKLTYTAGDTLDLSGIVVDIIYNDDIYDSIPLASFSAKNITASPAHGAALTPSHNGTAVTVSHGGFSATSSSLTVNVGTLSGTPTITVGGGQLEVGATLTAGTNGLNTQSGLTYQWKADGTAISGATSSTYTITAADLGKAITVTVTASGNYTGSVTSATSPPVPYKVIVGGYSNNGDTVTAQTAYRGTGDTVTINYTLTSGAFINTLSLGHGITITTTGSQTYSYTVNASHATNGTITLTPVFTHESTLSGIDVVVNEPSTGAVPQATVSSLASYYDSSTVTWSPAVTGGKFLGSTVYTATITLYVNAGNATFASTFAAKVNGYDATVTMIVQPTLFASGYITFTYTFPATDARVVSSIAVTTQPTRTEYYSGEKLDLSGLVVTATYNDGTTGQVIPTGYAIDSKNVTPGTTILTHAAHDDEPVTVAYDSKTAATGDLTVKLSPSVTNITVTGITAATATISYTAIYNTSESLEYRSGNGAWQSAANDTPITGLSPNTVYDYRITVSDGTKDVVATGKFQTAPQAPSGGATVNGTVSDITGLTIIVTLEHGNTAKASVTANETSAGTGIYTFQFTNVLDGVYNLVVDNGSYKVTQAITVLGGTVSSVIYIDMASGKTQSVVDIVSNDTPPAAVEGLPDLFNTAVYTSDDQYFVNNEGGMVEIKLAVEKQNAPSEAGVITTAAGSTQEIGLFLDISVIKSLYTSVGELTHEEKLPDLGASNLLTITFELPSSMYGKTIMAIYRVHGAGVDTLTKTSSPEYFEQNGNIITLHVHKFSTYALAVAKDTDNGSGGTGGGSGSGGGSSNKSGASGGGGSIEIGTPSITSTIIKGFDDKNVKVGTFGRYTSYIVEITAEQAKRITTAVVPMSDGTERHVPTSVYQENGKWYAKVYSLTDSAFTLIYNERTFSDAKGKWYESAVNEMASRKIIEGIGNNLFAGEREMTRAEFAVIIIRALGLPENGNGTVFSDVPASAWYAGAVGKAYEYGIVSGIGNGMFAPDRKITRQEAMAAIQHAAKIAGYNGSSGSISVFTDADSVSSWALEAVRWNVGSGLVSGSDGKLNPVSNITRAETAALMLKLLQKAGLVDTRTSLITAPMSKAAAVITVEPRKEPDPIQVTEDNDEETTKPEDDGNVPDVSDDTDSGTAVAERMTPQEAITTLNNLLAMCGAVTKG